MGTSRVFVLRYLAGLAAAGAWVAPSAARADDHRVAVNVSVGRGLKLDGSDLSRVVRSQLGRYGGVVALPEATTKDAIAEERATTNSRCRSGVLDQKCQLALGSALAASHWLEVLVTKPGKSCEVSLEYLSIQRESSDGGDNVPAACDRDAVAGAVRQGLETIARKQRWPVPERPVARHRKVSSPEAEEPNDALSKALREAEASRDKAVLESERLRAAEERWPAISQLAQDRATPLAARSSALRAYVETYAGLRPARDAERLLASLEEQQALATKKEAEARMAEESKRATEESRRLSRVEMVVVPSGEFIYGCNPELDAECDEDEKPRRRVTLPTFRIDRSEVTVAAYKACVDAGRCSVPKAGRFCNWDTLRTNHPVNCVDFHQARLYCAWREKRLPTELEWEKAARGTDGRKYPWGNEGLSSGRFANIEGLDDRWAQTAPVGTFPAGWSPWGAEDMIGNVWEWCDADYSTDKKVMRGGSWRTERSNARASSRERDDANARLETLGFRCAASGE
jgi:formylglycine-generating enzyme required for sulfatase activity